jgi:hypothetical protein
LPASAWLDFQAACAYLSFSADKLHKLTAAKAIRFANWPSARAAELGRARIQRLDRLSFVST